MNTHWVDGLGWAGAVLLLFAYALVSLRRCLDRAPSPGAADESVRSAVKN